MARRVSVSKTEFMQHQRCERLPWLNQQQNLERDRQVDESTQSQVLSHFRNQDGYAVESFAEQLFPGAVSVDELGFDALNQTYQAIHQRAQAILQPSAQSLGNYARADIMSKLPMSSVNPKHREFLRERYNSVYGSPFALNEVKSSTKVKDEYITDLAFQMHVFRSAGINVQQANLIHVNSDYVRNGDIDPSQFLITEDVTDQVLQTLDQVVSQIPAVHKTLNSFARPEVVMFQQCKNTKNHTECPQIHSCWSELPEAPIQLLPRLSKKKFDSYLEEGIQSIDQIELTDKRLTKTQRPIVEAFQSDGPVIDLLQIKTFLDSIDSTQPISFIDFETFSSAIPLDKARPFQDHPIQFSSAVLSTNGAVTRGDYISNELVDVSHEFSEKLLDSVADTGTVLSWYAPFEKKIIGLLAENAPSLSDELLALKDRVVDLAIPFSKGSYVDKRFKGSFSLKKVLPVLAPDLSYEELTVNNGSQVGSQWLEMVQSTDPKVKYKIMSDLQTYCSLDTTAMIRIYQELQSLMG